MGQDRIRIKKGRESWLIIIERLWKGKWEVRRSEWKGRYPKEIGKRKKHNISNHMISLFVLFLSQLPYSAPLPLPLPHPMIGNPFRILVLLLTFILLLLKTNIYSPLIEFFKFNIIDRSVGYLPRHQKKMENKNKKWALVIHINIS